MEAVNANDKGLAGENAITLTLFNDCLAGDGQMTGQATQRSEYWLAKAGP